MSRLQDTLSLASAALQTHRVGLQVAGHNVANVNTEGYSRQRVELTASQPIIDAGHVLGMGVAVQDVARSRDEILQARLYRDAASLGRFEAQERPIAQLQVLFPLDDDVGIDASLRQFFDAWNSVASDPTSMAARQHVLATSKALVREIRLTAQGLEDLRSSADQEVSRTVERVNQLAKDIAHLDRQIRSVEATGGSAGDLRDAQDRALLELSRVAGARSFRGSDGSLSVVLPGGRVLVEQGSAATMETELQADGHLAVVYVGRDGTRVDVTGQLPPSGKLGGTLELRDGTLADMAAGLDNFVFELARAVNQVHEAGFGLDGQGGRPLFVPIAAMQGAASNLAVDPGRDDLSTLAVAQDAAALPGDNRAALAMLQLRDRALAPGMGTPIDELATLFQQAGAISVENQNRLDTARVAYDTTDGLVQSVAGVSMDEEMVDLVEVQNAFQASARVIRVVDDLFDTVIGLK